MDITQLILNDHHEQRRLFAILEQIDRADTGTLGAVWARLSAFAVNLANGDHMAEEEREGLTDFRRLAGLTLRHDLAVAFTAFEARHFAGVPAVDKDPARYVREEEQRFGPPTSPPAGSAGSLGIGSLKGR